MSVDFSRLSNVIFDHGIRLTETEFSIIQEEILSERFTLNEHVVGYKNVDSVFGKIPFKLNDGKTVLMSEDFITKMKTLDVDHESLVSYMNESYDNFSQVVMLVLSNG